MKIVPNLCFIHKPKRRITMLFKQLQKISWIVPISIWTGINVFGLLLINGSPFYLLSQNLTVNKTIETDFMLFLAGYYFFAGCIFALLQTIFVSRYHFSRAPFVWFVTTWTSILFIICFNFIIFNNYIYPFIRLIFKYSISSTQQFVGVTNYSESLVLTVISALVVGLILGLISGIILGVMQGFCVRDPQNSRKWMVATILSFLLSFTVLSVGYSTLAHFSRLSNEVQQTRAVILGLIYSLSTIIPVVKNTADREV